MALINGNKDSNVGIIILWTNIDVAKEKIDENNYFLMGNLFSDDEGINTLIRGLLKNKNIRHLVLCGVDMKKTGDLLVKMFEEGVVELDKEISSEQVTNVIDNVELHDLRGKQLAEVNDYVKGLSKLEPWGDNEDVADHVIDRTDFSNEQFGFEIFDNNIDSAKGKIQKMISKFGLNNRDASELFGIRCVLENANAGNSGLDINTDEIANELKETGIVFIDLDDGSLIDIAFVKEKKLNLISRFVDLNLADFDSLVLKLRKTQEDLAKQLGVNIGNTIIDLISVYSKDNIETKRSRISDPRGNILIEIKDDKIYIKQLSRDGKRQDEFYGSTAKDCINWLINEQKVKLLEHAFDLGRELEKAELALKNNLEYEQDKELRIQ